MNTLIQSATGDRQVLALRLLFSRFPLEEQETRLRDALIAAERGTLQLDHLLLAKAGELSVGAALVMLQSDGVALVWPPVISCGATDVTAVEDRLMEALCARIDDSAARLAQCLLAPDDEVEAAILGRHGFDRATDMFFLARAITASDLISDQMAGDAVAISRETYGPENSERFVRLIEETYRGSLDCSYLNGIRTGREAIASHKLSGVFNPECWTLYSIDGEDAGVILIGDHPDQDAAELVYLGVAPGARGQKLGRRMLRESLSNAARRGRGVMYLAVDCENHFANSLYSEFEFSELARRRVMLRCRAGLARQ